MATHPWRTRCLLELSADLGNEPFLMGNHWNISRPTLRESQWPSHIKVVDAILNGCKTSNAAEAHIAGLELINTFLDRLSLVTYSRCTLLTAVSTCPASISVGVEFQIVTHDLYWHVAPTTILPDHIAHFEKLHRDSPVHEAAHHVRKALSEGAAEQHLLHLHIAAERIALSETDEKVRHACPSCKHEWDGQPASRRAVRALLGKRGVSTKDSDDAVNYRGRIAHGGGERNLAFYERVTELAGAVEGAVLSSIAERSGAKVLQRRNIVIGMPITVSHAVKIYDGSFSIVGSHWTAPARVIELGEDVSEPGGTVGWGFPTDKNHQALIAPLGWPD